MGKLNGTAKHWATPAIAILCLAGLEALALWKGIDGYLFGLVVAAIAGIAGFKIKDIIR